MSDNSQGKLIVLSGPSGVGKTTVLKGLLARFAGQLRLSVSATTRPPRPGEVDGQDYHFLTPEKFEKHRQEGEFLECCEVFGGGHWYGTPLDEVKPSLEAGKWVILEIDVEGMGKVVEHFPDAETIFVRPESNEELERRLRGRETDSPEAIERRLKVARGELAKADTYRHQVVNDTVENAVNQISDILTRNEESSV